MSPRVKTKTLEDLEWPKLLEHLATRATSELAAGRCRELPFLEPAAALAHLELIRELDTCIGDGDPPPALPARDVDEALTQIRGEGVVEAESLIDLAANLKLFIALARYLENRRDTCPRNWAAVMSPEQAPAQIAMARLAAEIDSAFEPDGTIADSASAAIGPLRRKVVSLREALLERLGEIAEAEDDLLQERTVTLRNNRFVIPVRADAHRRVRGIVHGTSGTGATIFVEPEAVVDLGNQLMLAREEVRREEARILAELRGAVRDMLDEVCYACEAIVVSEVRIAAARLSRDLEASIPRANEPGKMEIIGARHPLLVLEGVDVVPGDLSVRPGQAMLISGPNAGGKTVVLKTVGLTGLMLSAGLPVPLAPESRFGIPVNVLTDIGDDQSLELSLSTFSAHMQNIASALEIAGPGSLVLLDELAAGTDPAEGAALAEALLAHLAGLGATTLATTHYDVLKTRAQDTDGFVNAAMGFDVESARPTFEIHLGLPGSSSALSVAERYGIPASVVERAVELLPEGVRELAGAVEALEQERARAALERLALSEQRKLLEDATQRHDRELQHLRSRQDRFVDDESRALWSAIRSAREKVRDAERKVRRRAAGTEAVRKIRDQINAIAEELEPGGKLNPTNEQDLPGRRARTGDIVLGAQVFIVSMGKEATVDSPAKGGRVYARCGAVRMRLDVGDLRVIDRAAPAKPRGSARGPLLEATVAGSAREREAIRTSENTLDMRGMTVDEALSATDAFLDKALRDGLDAVFLIHGHGTGALRDAVRDYLSTSRYVKDFRQGDRDEGGDGISVAWID